MHIDSASRSELEASLADAQKQHQVFLAQQLALDLTRGKPAAAQLDLSSALLDNLAAEELTNGTDLRNYGILKGLPAAQQLFGEILGIDQSEREQRVFIGGNSSLSLMHYVMWFAYHLGLRGENSSWLAASRENGQRTKILCPCPGYDRHYSICEQLGIEMVSVPLTGNGPDMDCVEALVKADNSIKGIWCVPRFSNPTGEVYSEQTVARLAALPAMAGDHFLVLWDNAYAVHNLSDDAAKLTNIDSFAKRAGSCENIVQFGSTSKITFAGAGIGYMATGPQSMVSFSHHFSMASIGSDKINQLRHIKFLKDLPTIQRHMAKHADIIKPKFDIVANTLNTALADSGMGEWNDPQGGYFVSFNTRPGLAKQVIALAAEAGVKLTPAGATFPLRKDPEDKNIRIAPTLPTLDELEQAMQVFVNCVKLASIKQQLA